tara:strand:- start:1300 stop:1743 length:444 start_codon:yes stop_codon:yes gene_type:complete
MTKNSSAMKFIDVSDIQSLKLRKEYLTKQFEEAKQQLDDFNKNLEQMYLDKAKKQLNNEGKDFGTANFEDNGVKVKVELRKRTSWDQEKLLEYLNTLPGDLARHYSKVSITVPDARFTNATPDVKKELQKFRTVSLQGVKITFGENE